MIRTLLGWADHLGHKTLDRYIDAKVRDHHLPGWGRLQLWQNHLCNVYERTVDWEIAKREEKKHKEDSDD